MCDHSVNGCETYLDTAWRTLQRAAADFSPTFRKLEIMQPEACATSQAVGYNALLQWRFIRRRQAQRQRHRRPSRACGRNRLMHAMRESSFEIRLESQRARAQGEPRSVGLLMIQQILHAALIHRIGHRHSGMIERNQRTPSGICAARDGGHVAPSAIGALQRDHILPRLRDASFIFTRPREPLQT